MNSVGIPELLVKVFPVALEFGPPQAHPMALSSGHSDSMFDGVGPAVPYKLFLGKLTLLPLSKKDDPYPSKQPLQEPIIAQ